MSIIVKHHFAPSQSPAIRKAGILCPVGAVGLYALLPLVAEPETLRWTGMYAVSSPGGGLALSGTDMYTTSGWIAALLVGVVVFCLLLALSFSNFMEMSVTTPEDVFGQDNPNAERDAARAAHAAEMDTVAAEQHDAQPLPGNTFPAPPA